MSHDYKQLTKIATKSLRACYHDGKVVASPTHFSDYWARDTFWALPGMLAIGDFAQAKNCLVYFFGFQRVDGKIPRKISLDINSLKYLTGKVIKRTKPKPTYHGLVKPFYAMDSELLLINACEMYVERTGDVAFLQEHFHRLEKAIDWHVRRAQDCLVREDFLGNWMDTVLKFGPVLYTNTLYYQALKQMEAMSYVLNYTERAKHFAHMAQKTQRAIQKRFWNGAFFSDEARLKHRTTFDVAGNVLAIYFNVASKEQKDLILHKLEKYYETYGAFVGAVPTGQRWWKINPVVRLMRIADYHTLTSWLWIDVLLMYVFAQNNRHSISTKMMVEFSRIAQRDGEIGETYFTNGEVYKKRLWRSASPFAWSSGVILVTSKLVAEKLKNDKSLL